MKVKLQIAIALSHSAKMLILDEPTSGLDPVARDEICDLLKTFVSNKSNSVMFSTHITSDLEKVADYIVFILNGRIAYSGEKNTLLTQYVRITGSPKDVCGVCDELIIGYRGDDSTFEGLVSVADSDKLPGTIKKEKASLDELIVLLNRGESRQ
jgi:ABC-2 type transport system ATP-binding protein